MCWYYVHETFYNLEPSMHMKRVCGKCGTEIRGITPHVSFATLSYKFPEQIEEHKITICTDCRRIFHKIEDKHRTLTMREFLGHEEVDLKQKTLK